MNATIAIAATPLRSGWTLPNRLLGAGVFAPAISASRSAKERGAMTAGSSLMARLSPRSSATASLQGVHDAMWRSMR